MEPEIWAAVIAAIGAGVAASFYVQKQTKKDLEAKKDETPEG